MHVKIVNKPQGCTTEFKLATVYWYRSLANDNVLCILTLSNIDERVKVLDLYVCVSVRGLTFDNAVGLLCDKCYCNLL